MRGSPATGRARPCTMHDSTASSRWSNQRDWRRGALRGAVRPGGELAAARTGGQRLLLSPGRALEMRMDPSDPASPTAADLVNNLSAETLTRCSWRTARDAIAPRLAKADRGGPPLLDDGAAGRGGERGDSCGTAASWPPGDEGLPGSAHRGQRGARTARQRSCQRR